MMASVETLWSTIVALNDLLGAKDAQINELSSALEAKNVEISELSGAL